MSSDVTAMYDEYELKARYDHWRNLLKSHVVEVGFTKVDGTQTTMVCTLIPEILEKFPVNQKPLSPKAPDDTVPDAVRVWNVDKKAWRSFRMDSVNSLTILPIQA